MGDGHTILGVTSERFGKGLLLDRARSRSTEIAVPGKVLFESEFFAPVYESSLDQLYSEYQARRADFERIVTVLSPDLRASLNYFVNGNKGRSEYAMPLETMLNIDGAIAELNTCFWRRTLAMTDIYACMPNDVRLKWDDNLEQRKVPSFDPATVRSTLTHLLASREKFFAERVDGVFRGLSGLHVTNSPQGFGKRMIIAGMSCEGRPSDRKKGLLTDLRLVIARFMGREGVAYLDSGEAIEVALSRGGAWVTLDGGALRLRCYKVGTAHLEVSQEIAWRLNSVLAYLYPAAIPSSCRQRPTKMPKTDFPLMDRPLPFPVIQLLGSYQSHKHPREFTLQGYKAPKEALNEAVAVMKALGGVAAPKNPRHFVFDYSIHEVIQEVALTGVVPSSKAYQFYPTPECVGTVVADMAGVQSHHSVLEPSAGHGDLADLMPTKANVTCVEISRLHCKILAAKGYADVVEADFITWAKSTTLRFDRIVMNPPFSEGRARLHVEVALNLLKPRGVLAAVLPASHNGQFQIDGWSVTYSEVLSNRFSGTSTSVVVARFARTDESE